MLFWACFGTLLCIGSFSHQVIIRSSRSAVQGFSLKALQHLVLDEADRLLNMDFEQEIDQILKVRFAPRTVLGCSATR